MIPTRGRGRVLGAREVLVALAGLVAPPPAASRRAPGGGGQGDAAHGFSMYGDLKYPAGFTHFDYVNPDAPKGGDVSSRPSAPSTR